MLKECFVVFFLIVVADQFGQRKQIEEFNINFQQNDYNLEVERMETVRYDKNFIQFYNIRTFKYNRTCTAFNFTYTPLIDDVEKLYIILQAYKFASNEYRLFPMRFQYNYCDAMFKNMFGYGRQYMCGNLTKCGVEKGKTYHICNWVIDQSKFPPLIPSGRYMIELQHMYLSHEVLVVRGYGSVVRPFKGL